VVATVLVGNSVNSVIERVGPSRIKTSTFSILSLHLSGNATSYILESFNGKSPSGTETR
jgi:hypothetical protein